MPPLPTTLDAEVQASIASLQRRQTDLENFQIPRLRTCKGPLTTQQQFASELREDIDAFARDLDKLSLAVDDQRGERNRRELASIVDDLKRILVGLRKDTRAALLASKRSIDANALSNREELMRSSAVREKQNLDEKVAEDALMTANNNVTEALQRTLVLMQGELEKSVLSTQLLDASTASLKAASSTHDVLDGLMQTSKHLITALEKSDWLDRLLIIAALVFFLLVVLFVVQQRIVNRGLRIAFWWTRFLPSSSSGVSQDDGLVEVMEKGSIVSTLLASSVVTAVSAVLSSATSAASLVASSSLEVPVDLPTSVAEVLESTHSESVEFEGTTTWTSTTSLEDPTESPALVSPVHVEL